MNVAEIMGQQNYRNRFRNLARIIRGNFTMQNANAVRNCMHDIPVAAPDFAVAIFFGIQHRHIGVMHPVMGRGGIAGIRARWIRLPKIVQLLLDRGLGAAGIAIDWTEPLPNVRSPMISARR